MPSTLEWVTAALSAVGVVFARSLAIAVDRANADRRTDRALAGAIG